MEVLDSSGSCGASLGPEWTEFSPDLPFLLPRPPRLRRLRVSPSTGSTFGDYLATAGSRLASQSRVMASPFRSIEIFLVILVAATLPLYLAVMVLPFYSRVTENESSPSFSLPSAISVWVV